ncbi:hypothetical protein, partial [Caminibacter sp.]
MKKILILFTFIFLFAGNIDDLIKKVPKNSPEYNLDIVLYKKIKEIKYKPLDLKFNIKNEKEYINLFLKLIELKKELNSLPDKINELDKKISILKNNQTVTQKLQYIYYKKIKEVYLKRLDELQKKLPEFEEILLEKLKNIKFDVKKAQNNIKLLKEKLSRVQKYYEKLNIELQKWQLLNNKTKINEIQKKIRFYEKKQQKIYRELFKNQLIIGLNYIKNRNKKALESD